MLKTILFVMAIAAGTAVLTSECVVAANLPSPPTAMTQPSLKELKEQEQELKEKVDQKQTELSRFSAAFQAQYRAGRLYAYQRSDYEKRQGELEQQLKALQAQYAGVQAQVKTQQAKEKKPGLRQRWFKKKDKNGQKKKNNNGQS